MNYKCNECNRYCDVMINGYTEMAHGGAICDKCLYGEWTITEKQEREIEEMLEKGECCPTCHRGCDYCLMLEPRSMK